MEKEEKKVHEIDGILESEMDLLQSSVYLAGGNKDKKVPLQIKDFDRDSDGSIIHNEEINIE